jgi:molybdate transport system substrate-binding protein
LAPTRASAALCALALAGTGLLAGTPRAGAAGGLAVYAAASLTDAFPAIDPSANYSFAGSNALAAQIELGAPADILASANTQIPATLYAKGLVEQPVDFTRNTLVIVVPASNPASIRTGVTIAVASPGVPVGDYARQVLGQMNLSSQVLANVVSEDADVRDVLTQVALGQVDAGFVYATDARTVGGQVKVITVPAWAEPKVTYAMAVVTASPNQRAAKAFVAEVLSRAGQAKLRRYGFLPLRKPAERIAVGPTRHRHK